MTTILLHQPSGDGDSIRLLCQRYPERFVIERENDLEHLTAECGAGLADTDIYLLGDAVQVGPYENGRLQYALQLLALDQGLRLVVSTAPDRPATDTFWASVEDVRPPAPPRQVGRGDRASMAALRAITNYLNAWGWSVKP